MQRSQRVLLSLAFLALSAACSDQKPERASSVKDAVDQSTGSNTLLWFDQDKLFRGDCQPNQTLNRAHCAGNVSSQPLASIQTRTEAALAQNLTELTARQAAEVKRLKDADPTVIALTQQIAAQTTQKAALDHAVATYTQTLAAAKTDLAANQATVTELEAQIVAINARLAQDPQNRDLLRLREQSLQDQAVAAGRVEELTALVNTTQAQLTNAQTELAEVQTELTAMQAEYQTTYAALVVQSTALDSLVKEIKFANDVKSRIAAVLELIKQSDITYRGNLLNEIDRETLKRINAIMGTATGLKPGRYEDSTNYYCPQRATPRIEGGRMTGLALTFLSPCGGSGVTMTCTGNNCSGSGYRVVVKNDENYSFADGGNVGNFVFKSAR